MGCFTPYENFKTLTTNDLQFHSPIRFNQSGPGMPVSKITFHAHPYQTGLQPVLQWKVQTFPRTVHTAPHHTTFCGLQPWKVIFVSHFPVFLISHIRNQIALPRTFCSTSDTSGRKTPSQTLFKSLCVTSGNCRPASQPTPGHIPIFPMCNIRSEYGLAHGFSSRSVTSGTNTPLHAVIPPHLLHWETSNLPQSPLQATFPFFRCVTSGAKTPLHTLISTHPSYRE